MVDIAQRTETVEFTTAVARDGGSYFPLAARQSLPFLRLDTEDEYHITHTRELRSKGRHTSNYRQRWTPPKNPAREKKQSPRGPIHSPILIEMDNKCVLEGAVSEEHVN